MKLQLGDTEKKGSGSTSSKGWVPAKKNVKSKRFLTFLFFVLISSGFWFLQSLQTVYTMRITVPITYDLPPDIGYSKEGLPKEIVFFVKDKGIQLLDYNIKDFEPIRVSEVGQREGKGKIVLTNQRLMEKMTRQLSSNTNITLVWPSDISIDYFQLKQKRVPVLLGFDPTVSIGYQVARIMIDPAEVEIYGDEKTLNSISAMYTERYDFGDLKTDIDIGLGLISPSDIETRTKEVHVSLKVEQLTERSFDLPIEAIDSPLGVTLRPLPSRAKLYVTVPVDRFASLKAEDFALAISYLVTTDSASTPSPPTLPVQMRMKPDWVVRYRIEPASVQYILETNGRATDSGSNGRNR